MVPTFIHDAVAGFARRVRERFADRVVDVRLFGSWARDEAHAGSDIDVIVIIAGLTGAEATEVRDLAYDCFLDGAPLLAVTTLSAEEFGLYRQTEALLARDVLDHGIPL
jgi:predicted nucleotidyltransferase